jgi:hypothetical protein
MSPIGSGVCFAQSATSTLVNADGLTRAPMVTEATFSKPEGRAPCSGTATKVGNRLVCPDCKDLPENIKKHAAIGRQKDLPQGFLVYQDLKGSNAGALMMTPLGKFEPRQVPGIEKVTGRMDLSDDGKWVVTFRPWNQPVLVALDGSGVIEVPHAKEIKWHRDEESFIGFWHSYPGKGGAIWVACIDKIYAIDVDLSRPQPTFGPLRVVAELSGIGAGWMRDVGVAGSHAFGGLGAPYSMLTLSPQASAPAGAANLWIPKGQARFSCGCHISWDGKFSSHNPGGVAKNPPLYDRAIPGGGTHTGPVILAFREAGSGEMDAAELEIQRSASVNWAPREYYSAGHDWHEWHFTNNNEYLTGRMLYTPQGQKQAQKGGIWVLHWPTSTWTQVTPANLGGKGDRHVAFFTKAPVGASSGKPAAPVAVRPAAAPAASAPATSAPASVTIEATIVAMPTIPAVSELGIYRNILAFVRYRVDKVVSGELKDSHVLVVHWAIKDRAPLAAASYKVGDRHRLVCEPFDDKKHGEMMSVQRADDTGDYDSRRYWPTAIAPVK